MSKEKCVLCGMETPIDKTTHISLRQGYIEGAGQVCLDCYDNEILLKSNK